MLLGAKAQRKFKLIPLGKNEIIINKPTIFAVNHSNCHDTTIVCEIVKKHLYVLAGKENLKVVDKLIFLLNGVVFVDRRNKESRAHSKEKAISIINKGNNLLIFPEGTWNLTDSNLMLPLNWGIIDIAKITNAPVVPINLEYTKTECYYTIGEELYFDKNISKKEAINRLTDYMATLRFNTWEYFSKNNIRVFKNKLEYRDYIQYCMNEYPKLDIEFEKSIVLKRFDTYNEAFAHLENLNPNKNNAFLFNKRFM